MNKQRHFNVLNQVIHGMKIADETSRVTYLLYV